MVIIEVGAGLPAPTKALYLKPLTYLVLNVGTPL